MGKMQNSVKQRRVLAAFRLSYSSNRGFLAGVARYLKRHPNWQVIVAENFTDFDDMSIAAAARAGFNGIITVRPHTTSAERAIALSSLPIAMLGTGSGDCRARKRNIVFIRGKDRAIGILAAKHFMSLGNFRSYAFVGTYEKVSWSSDRQRGFASELHRRNRKVVVLQSPFPNGSPDDIAFLARKLISLPNPPAVMAAYDNRARNVLLACEAAGLDVPHQIAVIGVDDDSVLCDFSRPALTSITTHPANKGERAAAELERIMCKRNAPATTIFVPDADIVERESTAPIAPSSHLVERALHFIALNALGGISARDVIAHLGVSHTLAGRRFRECNAGTIGKAINNVKIDEVKRLLRETKMPISRITAQCGIASENYAKRLFRNMTGISMRDYRARNRRGVELQELRALAGEACARVRPL